MVKAARRSCGEALEKFLSKIAAFERTSTCLRRETFSASERLATIRAKVKAYDWSQLPGAGGWTAGVGLHDLKRLVAYWLDVYDWREVEHRLNQFPNFTTDVEGSDYTSSMYGEMAPNHRFFFSTAGRAHISNLNVCSVRLRQMAGGGFHE